MLHSYVVQKSNSSKLVLGTFQNKDGFTPLSSGKLVKKPRGEGELLQCHWRIAMLKMG